MYDYNGKPLKEGDIVNIPCKIESIFMTENGQYSNLTVRTVYPMPPYTEGTVITLNTKQTLKVDE